MKLVKFAKRVIKNKGFISRSKYLKFISTMEIDENAIFLECQHGTNINGNIFYLLKELCTNEKYKNFKKYISVNKTYKEEISSFLNYYSFKNYEFVEMNTDKYFQKIASSKYLINDNTFLPFFIKRDEQVYLNTWHGTPLKTLGKKINNDFHNIGNTMKNFYVADYLLYPNEYTKQHMIEDYMLENLANNETVLNGYPRNSIFFDKESEANIRNKYQLNGKKVIAYMPTWRGTVANKEISSQINTIVSYLEEVETQLDENTVMYVNLHPIVHSSIDFSNFKKILSFPKDVETYEFLNACDVLVTDYSSVFFDFATTKKKIILFTYDLEEYLADRGLYVSLDELPFPKANTVAELMEEIRSDKNYDDEEFVRTYCPKDNIHASKELLDLLLFNERTLKIEKIEGNGKPNILIYSGNLMKNGITTALLNLLNNIDTNKYNFYLTFSSLKVAPYKSVLKTLPEGVNYIPLMGKMNASVLDKVYLNITRKSKFKHDWNNKIFDRLYRYEIKRCYGNIKFDHVVQFSGYEVRRQLMFGRFECKKSIFVHSNMVQEINVRKNQHPNAIRYAYNHYDNVAIVTEDMREPTKEFCFDENKICVVNNVIDYQNVLDKSKEELTFDDNTESNFTLEEIKEICESDNKKFITVGRFSPEKGHMRLLKAFDRFWKDHQDVYLFIIGGHGPLYQQTIDTAASLDSRDHIVIIKSLINPYNFLNHCDYFVFTSFYEAFGLGLVEADILGIPVMSTDILGPRGFMKKNNGLLVGDNEDGIYEGLNLLFSNNIKPMNVDYRKYNENAVQQFEQLLTR